MSYYFLGIDIGTGSCKCTVIDGEGAVIAEASSGYAAVSPNPGWSEQDPAEWYASTIRTLGKIESGVPGGLKGVAAVGVTGQMRGVTFIGGDGETVRNSILWNDNRCVTEADELGKEHADLFRAITINPLNTMCTLPKLLWMMKHEPDAWRATRTIIYPKDYIAYRLTGDLHTDHSDASGSSLYDIRGRVWSPELTDLFSISPGKLPPVRRSTEIIGTVSAKAARETGINEGVPVAAGGSDAVTELFSAGIAGPGQCKLRLGTSGALSTAVSSLDGIAGSRHYCWSYIEPDSWMLDINTRSCAQAVSWLGDVFYGTGDGDHDPASVYSSIEKDASAVPAGAGGLIFHPYLMGEDAPYWDPDLRASFWGITSAHSRPHFARALFEGTAFALRDARSALGKIADGFREYIFVGGGTKNRLWVSIVADVLGVDAVLPAGSSASAGAAMLAGIGAGAFKDPEDALRSCVKGSGMIRFDAVNHSFYDALFEKYKRIKLILDGIYS